MIPRAAITAWRRRAPWPDDSQVEQDLVLCRALVEVYERPLLREQTRFRGGTALHKLHFEPAGRYSEDLDLVQFKPGPIGPIVDELHDVLDPWLGAPKFKASEGRFTLTYRFDTTVEPIVKMRLKVEINTREHFSVLEPVEVPLGVDSAWFRGEADIPTYALPELLGTKLRALYQRKKGRDLFDLALGLERTDLDRERVIEVFGEYMRFGGTPVTRAEFESNMFRKMSDASFLGDLGPLLAAGIEHDAQRAWVRVHSELVSLLPGEPWKGIPRAARKG